MYGLAGRCDGCLGNDPSMCALAGRYDGCAGKRPLVAPFGDGNVTGWASL